MMSLSVSLLARSLRCFPILLTLAAWATPSVAQSLDPFYAYLNDQKYTLYLGDSRGACSYHIDPTDVYANGESRFVMAKVSSGMKGSGCRGVLAFEVLQADCSAEILYQLSRSAADDPRNAGWQHFEFSLYDGTQSSISRITTQELAQKVCALPTKPSP
jgi:hypothetical protein